MVNKCKTEICSNYLVRPMLTFRTIEKSPFPTRSHLEYNKNFLKKQILGILAEHQTSDADAIESPSRPWIKTRRCCTVKLETNDYGIPGLEGGRVRYLYTVFQQFFHLYEFSEIRFTFSTLVMFSQASRSDTATDMAGVHKSFGQKRLQLSSKVRWPLLIIST